MTIRCPACLGAKKVNKIGGMKLSTCNHCEGVGRIEVLTPILTTPAFNDFSIDIQDECAPIAEVEQTETKSTRKYTKNGQKKEREWS